MSGENSKKPTRASGEAATAPSEEWLMNRLARDLLGSGRSVRLAAYGWSMRPCLRDGDVVEIAPAGVAGLRRGDVVAVAAAQSKGGGPDAGSDLIVHRLLRREGAALVLQGDACPAADAPVPDSALLGRVVVRERRGRSALIGSGWRRRAGRLVLFCGPLQRFAQSVYSRILKVYRGGPPLSLGTREEAARDRIMLRIALGEAPSRADLQIAFGRTSPARAPKGAPHPAALPPPIDPSSPSAVCIPLSFLESPRYRHLAPMVSWQCHAGAAEIAEPRFEERLRSAEETALFHSAQAEAMLQFLESALRDAGLELLLVKGTALAFTGVYPAPHLRRGADVDTLCRPERVRDVVRTLLKEGFRNAEPEYPLSYYFAYRNEVALFRENTRWPFLEIHWGPAGRLYYNRRPPICRLWEASREGPWGPALRVLSPEMEAVHSVVHMTKHLRALRPDWALDFALLSRQGLDWERVARELRAFRLEWPAWHALRWIESRIPGTVPREVIEEMRHHRRRAPWSWVEMQVLHARSDRRMRPIDALCLPTWRQRFGYLREQVAPSRCVMERLYPEARERRNLLPLHGKRWLRLLGETFRNQR